MNFTGTIIDVIKHKDTKLPNLVILDRSAIYPTSGGQQHDNGTMKISGCEGEYLIVDAIKVGKCVIHILDRPLEGDVETYKGKTCEVQVDEKRRDQLRAHHTGTHIMFAACKRVLGPHIW
jgi:alanyl-tRNA synthetase